MEAAKLSKGKTSRFHQDNVLAQEVRKLNYLQLRT